MEKVVAESSKRLGCVMKAALLLAAAVAVLHAHAPSIGLSRGYLNYTAATGGSSPLPQGVTLLNTTHGRMAWTATASTTRGGN